MVLLGSKVKLDPIDLYNYILLILFFKCGVLYSGKMFNTINIVRLASDQNKILTSGHYCSSKKNPSVWRFKKDNMLLIYTLESVFAT